MIASRRFLCILLTIDVLKAFLEDFGGDGANRPYRPARELRFWLTIASSLINFTAIGVASGVSSVSACSAGDEFSGPDESKLKSSGLRGVVKEGAR